MKNIIYVIVTAVLFLITSVAMAMTCPIPICIKGTLSAPGWTVIAAPVPNTCLPVSKTEVTVAYSPNMILKTGQAGITCTYSLTPDTAGPFTLFSPSYKNAPPSITNAWKLSSSTPGLMLCPDLLAHAPFQDCPIINK